ncbi:hypothetical protein INT45_001137 [Circinella minor]|uniref:Uncharacterized protein n=1 Tax=Circinella minor TaxID=1195481 RepID=A0A8H7RZJ0_9FUNG|nr:hypothetical protein INT45_001137 [Circinella minor]
MAQESSKNQLIVFGDSYTADHTDQSNGPKWIEQLGKTWDNISISNFAVGGACCYHQQGPSPPVMKQIDSYFSQNPTNDPSTSIYGIFVGINDMAQNQESNDVIVCIQGQMARLMEQVNGKQFLIFNMVPFDHSPKMRLDNQINYASQWIEKFNQELNKAITSMQQQYSNITIALIDTHATLDNVLNNPTNYGITKGVTDYFMHVRPDPGSDPGKLLTSGNQFFWFDQAHVTSIVHEQIQKAIVAQQPFPSLPLSKNSPGSSQSPQPTSSQPPSTGSSLRTQHHYYSYALVALIVIFIAFVSIR